MFAAVSEHGVTGRAVRQGHVELSYCNPRDYTEDGTDTVDDRPYGGGPGMVMMIDPLAAGDCRGEGCTGRRGAGDLPVAPGRAV